MPTEAVGVDKVWLDKVQAFLKDLREQIKTESRPARPGVFVVGLTNETEVKLNEIYESFRMHDAVEKAVKQMDEDMVKMARLGSAVVTLVEATKEKVVPIDEPPPAPPISPK